MHSMPLLTDSPQILWVLFFLQSFICLLDVLSSQYKSKQCCCSLCFCQLHSHFCSACCFFFKFDLILLFLSFFGGACLPQANVELQSEHNFGMSVTARTRGRTGLKVVLRVTDHKAGQIVGNQQELSDEIQIQVKDKKGTRCRYFHSIHTDPLHGLNC